MLLRRYGTMVQSVTLDFDPNSITEIAFRRDRAMALTSEEFQNQYEQIHEVRLEEERDGPIQSEAEAALLERLESRIREMLDGLSEDEVLLVENEQGVDYPKVRDRKQGIIVEGENRLHFHWRVDPPLRLGTYRRRVR